MRQNRGVKKQTMILSSGNRIEVAKNCELLNLLLHTNHKTFQRTRRKFRNDDCFIWLVEFGKVKNGWENQIIDNDRIVEISYCEHKKQTKGTYRLAFKKKANCFIFLGLYKTDKEKSTQARTSLIKILDKFDFEKSLDSNIKLYD